MFVFFRDRVADIWTPVSDHLARLIMASSSSGSGAGTWNEKKSFLLERSVTALLRLSVRLGRKEDLVIKFELYSSILGIFFVNIATHVNLIIYFVFLIVFF